MRRVIASGVVSIALLAVAASSFAVTYIVPSDRQLAIGADAIVVATAASSRSRINAGGLIETESVFVVDDAIKGRFQQGDRVSVVEPGGTVGGVGMIDTGAPQFAVGERRLLFLEERPGHTRTYGGLLGSFAFISRLDEPGELVVRSGRAEPLSGWDERGARWNEPSRRVCDFIAYLRAVVSGAPANADYTVSTSISYRPETSAAGSAYVYSGTLGGVSHPIRVDFPQTGSIVFKTNGSQPSLDGPGAGTRGTAAWRNASGVDVRFSLGGTTTKDLVSGTGDYAIIFNDPHDQISGVWSNLNPVVATAYFYYQSITSDHAGETFWDISHCDVVVQSGIPVDQTLFDTAVTHELGHCLGFRHSNEGVPTSSNAIMNSSIVSGIGSTLQQYDKDAVVAVYGTGVCTNPSIGTQPQSVSISSGSSTTLSVSASGTSPTYQWYVGTSGTTTSPIGGATSSSVQVSPSSTTSYWVRVSGCSTSVDSSTATVTVTCTPPGITTQPANKSITAGQSALLSVTATNATGYQWYVGTKGTTTSPVGGATSSSVSVSPGVGTTSYWVRVFGCNGSQLDSEAATVTVTCVTQITQQPQSKSISPGQFASLSVIATGGSLTYQWFIGLSGDTSNPIAGATNSSVAVNPSQTTKYWVRVTGCTVENSIAATVTVDCRPLITQQPASLSVPQGQSAQLTVAATGTVSSYQWYQGLSGNISTPVGTNSASLTVSPSSTTSYWVRLTNSCGSTDSQTATVTVTASTCPLVVIGAPTATPGLNGSFTLAVTATSTGSTVTIAWFQVSDAGSTQIGTGASIVVTPAGPATYFARATNLCGNFADSSTVTATTCTNPQVTQPANQTVTTLSSATITVTAASTSGALHYQWYSGAKGTTTTPVGTDSSTYRTAKITAAAQYWVHVTNDCGATDSETITVTPVKGRRRGTRR